VLLTPYYCCSSSKFVRLVQKEEKPADDRDIETGVEPSQVSGPRERGRVEGRAIP
jgi:hypothetical protein